MEPSRKKAPGIKVERRSQGDVMSAEKLGTWRGISQRRGEGFPPCKDKAEETGKGGNARTLIAKFVRTTPMSATRGVAVSKSAPE